MDEGEDFDVERRESHQDVIQEALLPRTRCNLIRKSRRTPYLVNLKGQRRANELGRRVEASRHATHGVEQPRPA